MHKSAMDVEIMKEIIAKVFTKLYIHNINWLNEGGGQMTDAPPPQDLCLLYEAHIKGDSLMHATVIDCDRCSHDAAI